jgi:hypothetical protein
LPISSAVNDWPQSELRSNSSAFFKVFPIIFWIVRRMTIISPALAYTEPQSSVTVCVAASSV